MCLLITLILLDFLEVLYLSGSMALLTEAQRVAIWAGAQPLVMTVTVCELEITRFLLGKSTI